MEIRDTKCARLHGRQRENRKRQRRPLKMNPGLFSGRSSHQRGARNQFDEIHQRGALATKKVLSKIGNLDGRCTAWRMTHLTPWIDNS
jgi:hypothetical protein